MKKIAFKSGTGNTSATHSCDKQAGNEHWVVMQVNTTSYQIN
jgi:hypothetical protein